MALASLFSRGGNVTIRHSRRKDGQTETEREEGRINTYILGVSLFSLSTERQTETKGRVNKFILGTETEWE